MLSVWVQRARLNQAGPSVPRPGLFKPHTSSGPSFELVKLQKALTSTIVKGLFVPARRDFCISFSLCVVCSGGFKLNQKKKKKREGRISTPDLKCLVIIAQRWAACLPPLLFLSKARVPSEGRRLRFHSSVLRSGWRGALCFPEASGWLNFRRRRGARASSPLLCVHRVG